MTDNEFQDFGSLYAHLEEEAASYRLDQIARLFRNLRDLLKDRNDEKQAQQAQWEVDFFSFVTEDGNLKPHFIGTNEEGQQVEYPSLKGFTEETYAYLKERATSTKNPVLKAHYGHILWCSPHKEYELVKQTIDSYLVLIGIYEEKDRESLTEHYGLRVLEVMRNLLALCYQIDYRTDDTKKELKRIIREYNRESTSSFKLRVDLIRWTLEQKKKFSDDDFGEIEEVCFTIANDLTKSGRVYNAIDMLKLGSKVDARLGKQSHNWKEDIAKSHEKQIEMAGSNLAASTHCMDAIECYKELKNQKKVKELEKKYSEIKTSLEMSKISPSPEIQEHIRKAIDQCKESAKEVVARESTEIIEFLMLSPDLVPTYDELEKRAKEHAEQFIMQYFFPIAPIDQSGHTSQHFTDDEEKEYYGILKELDDDLRFGIVLANEIFIESIKNGRLTFNGLFDYLSKNSWFGKNLGKRLPNNERMPYNWLNMLAPPIQEYFGQMEHYLRNPEYYPSMVLCIDSLTLKIEGLLRDICELSGVSTFYTIKDKKGRPVAREKDIHALLYEESVKALFSKDDLLFFKFLLVEKAGYNLRHRVAHSLMLFQEYQVGIMHLLIMALLRFGKYDFVKSREQDDSVSQGQDT